MKNSMSHHHNICHIHKKIDKRSQTVKNRVNKSLFHRFKPLSISADNNTIQ